MNTYTHTAVRSILVMMLGMPAILAGAVIGICQYVAYAEGYSMGFSAVPWAFLAVMTGFAVVIGAMCTVAAVVEEHDAQKVAREQRAFDSRWTDWDEALYACEHMTATRNGSL